MTHSLINLAGPEERVRYVHLKDGEAGYSYDRLFQGCLDGNVEWVEVEDPYIRARHQLHNFVRFCELVLKSCKRLKQIQLTTGAGDHSQSEVGCTGGVSILSHCGQLAWS